MLILIGSRALSFRTPGVRRRPCVDFDFVSTEAEAFDWLRSRGATDMFRDGDAYVWGKVDGTPCEFELVRTGTSTEQLADLAKADGLETPFGAVPSLDLLFTIKSSHRYKKNSRSFWKHLSDWHMMRSLGAKVRPEYEPFLKLREKESYQFAVPSLKQSKKDFFADDQIAYRYDHDSIHTAVAYPNRPAYQCFGTPGEEVMSSRQRFEACDRETQLASVVEESAVLAIERSLVPHPGVLTPEQAWRLAFSKVCTSIASGWWRQFAYENAPDVLRRYPVDYFARFERGLASGIVQPFAKAA